MKAGILHICTGLFILLLVGFTGCSRKKVPLDEKKFTALLIDLHRTDGTLSVARGLSGLNELKNYAYYNDLFRKYGITRAEFDSCMYYYSANTELFSQMYDVVIDSLNRQMTAVDMILRELKSKDSVNYFPVPDTLVFDSCYTHIVVEIDSLLPGQYKFSTLVQFDTLDKGKNNRITSFFVSRDNLDTLKVRDVTVMTDTIMHTYRWTQYVDSTYDYLVIKFVDADNLDKLKDRKGRAWKMELFKPYIPRETEKRLKQALHRR
ncbi:MAG: DUF4296 domain-containing protein [Odoribacter splanchnicus]|nr:DUF4296 domain-containing protein [Odoribacter splanchnicus]